MNILEACETFSVSRFIFSSSCTVYGDPIEKQVFEISAKSHPSSPYGFTKWMGEQIIEDLHKSSGFVQNHLSSIFQPDWRTSEWPYWRTSGWGAE